jgi:hypothetical protein
MEAALSSTLPATRGYSGHVVNHAAGMARLDMESLAALEARMATQDGYIWPLPRAEMVTREAIRERMVEDLRAAAREVGDFDSVCDCALLALGWSPEQVRLHGSAAARRFNAENPCGNDPAPAREVA